MCYNRFIVIYSKYMCGIYKIINTATNKMYVGKTKGEFKNRWRNHKRQLKKGVSPCKYLQNTWNKYGEEVFQFEVIAEGNFNKEELKQLEEIFIKLYGHYNILNISHTHKFSKERKQKMSKAMADKWKDPNHKVKVSKSIKQTWAKNYEELKATRWTHPAWELYPQIKEYWSNKSNGRGGNAHPGKTKIMNRFNIPRRI